MGRLMTTVEFSAECRMSKWFLPGLTYQHAKGDCANTLGQRSNSKMDVGQAIKCAPKESQRLIGGRQCSQPMENKTRLGVFLFFFFFSFFLFSFQCVRCVGQLEVKPAREKILTTNCR